MSIMENVYFYSKPVRQDNPAWYRLERYENCDVNTVKRSIFARFFGKKRSK